MSARAIKANEMYVIVSGFARVVGNEDGAEHAVNVIGPGAPVGEMAMLAGRPRAASVHATSDVEAAVLSIADFHRLASEYPRIYQDLGAIQSDRLAAMLERFVSGSFGRVTVHQSTTRSPAAARVRTRVQHRVAYARPDGAPCKSRSKPVAGAGRKREHPGSDANGFGGLLPWLLDAPPQGSSPEPLRLTIPACAPGP